MHATEVLQKCLGKSRHAIHALRSRALMRAVEATITGRRLTLIGLARAWPDAQRVRAPLKALDRLLGNRHLHVEREPIHAAMVRWLVRDNQPVIIRKSARREREPWILMASLELSMRQGVGFYARRMQIELSFRDLKSHHQVHFLR
jgi:hypothetical protein